MRFINYLSLAVTFGFSFVFAGQHGQTPQRSHFSRRGAALVRNYNATNIQKRFNSAPLTNFDTTTGPGACGKQNGPNDFIVALNTAQYGNGEHCFQTITINCGGKTAQAEIMDECPGCGAYGLDLTTGLFEHFADLGVGELSCSWSFGSGDSEPKPSPTPSPSPSPSPPPPTTTKEKEKPTSTTPPPPPPTTTSHKITTSKISVSTTSSTSSSPTTSATPTNSYSPIPTSVTDAENLYQLNMAILGLSELIVDAMTVQT